MKLPSYLRLNKHNIYVFRRRIPTQLLKYFKTNEIRQSLSVTSRRMAIIYSRVLASESDELFYRLEMNIGMDNVSFNLLNLVKHKKSLLIKDEYIDQLKSHLDDAHIQHNRTIKVVSLQHEREINLLKGVIEAGFQKPVKTLENDFKLTEAINQFFKSDQIQRRGDALATVRKDKDSLRLFVAIIGDKVVSEIGKQDALKFSKEAPFYGRRDAMPRAEGTVNGFMNSVSKFSGWLTAHHSETQHVQLDFSKLRYKKKRRPSEEREAFSVEEVIRILHHPRMAYYKKEEPAKYWLPFIAAYTGARLEEISQLSPISDIYFEEGVWILDINDKGDKSVKNAQSIRKIPVHSELIKNGFLDYVENLKVAKANTLFPKETIRDGRIGKNAGKRVNRFIQKVVGIDNKSLHCFRHTFATILLRAEVGESIAAEILGHKHGGITFDRYAKGFLSDTLKTAVEKVRFFNE